MSNKNKMVLNSIICFVGLIALLIVMISESFMTLKWYEMCVIYGFTVYLICKLWTCLSYWTVYFCGKEDITVSEYDYEVKTKYNRNAKYYSVKPVVEYKGNKFKGCSFWEFSSERLKDTKPVLNCRVLDKNLIIM